MSFSLLRSAALPTVLALLSGCHRPLPPPPVFPPPEVDVALPVVREGVEWDEYTGRLQATESVEVRSRVNGYLQATHFKPGQIVKKGDCLFTIDPREFNAEIDAARAEQSRSRAELELANFELGRVEDMRRDGAAGEKEYQEAIFAKRRAEAAVERAAAQLQIAELNLEWTRVTAAIDGRISRELVTVGNLINGGTVGGTLLTTIVSQDPIHCYFDVDEQTYLRYTRLMLAGERFSSRDAPNPVIVALFDETEFTHTGHMDFVENTIDMATGTLRGRAILRNPRELLLPGLFVRIRLVGTGNSSMTYVPEAAVAADQTQRVLYVVDDANIANARQVKLGRLRDGMRRVLAGVGPGDRVIVRGLQRVRPGTPVTPRLVELPVPRDNTGGPVSAPTQPAPAGGGA